MDSATETALPEGGSFQSCGVCPTPPDSKVLIQYELIGRI